MKEFKSLRVLPNIHESIKLISETEGRTISKLLEIFIKDYYKQQEVADECKTT